MLCLFIAAVWGTAGVDVLMVIPVVVALGFIVFNARRATRVLSKGTFVEAAGAKRRGSMFTRSGAVTVEEVEEASGTLVGRLGALKALKVENARGQEEVGGMKGKQEELAELWGKLERALEAGKGTRAQLKAEAEVLRSSRARMESRLSILQLERKSVGRDCSRLQARIDGLVSDLKYETGDAVGLEKQCKRTSDEVVTLLELAEVREISTSHWRSLVPDAAYEGIDWGVDRSRSLEVPSIFVWAPGLEVSPVAADLLWDGVCMRDGEWDAQSDCVDASMLHRDWKSKLQLEEEGEEYEEDEEE
ncbi:hypothetical protein SISSUDRAFT_1118176 [Sistotremastrum suecicum HHB10207 ss-3]|uniref:Uncharacterized protein n=1 Tax=Sistotremastrum suecicum HHB10207 ss-3 TaxID=1314776 RepID=A0A166FHB0_9AGAM|nr:hypothetical protein SISSUDRAFT_1118176 [Sistotremastrum suecicum HHB10207 ss-3]